MLLDAAGDGGGGGGNGGGGGGISDAPDTCHLYARQLGSWQPILDKGSNLQVTSSWALYAVNGACGTIVDANCSFV